jgi:hypothetical protein
VILAKITTTTMRNVKRQLRLPERKGFWVKTPEVSRKSRELGAETPCRALIV